jgi:hypothetical protein
MAPPGGLFFSQWAGALRERISGQSSMAAPSPRRDRPGDPRQGPALGLCPVAPWPCKIGLALVLPARRARGFDSDYRGRRRARPSPVLLRRRLPRHAAGWIQEWPGTGISRLLPAQLRVPPLALLHKRRPPGCLWIVHDLRLAARHRPGPRRWSCSPACSAPCSCR